MIETSLVYIYAIRPTKQFVGCGALIEGGYIATCRHVWRMAVEKANWPSGEQPEVEIEYPRARIDGATAKHRAWLKDSCEDLNDHAPDLVLLRSNETPSGVMPLQLAVSETYEAGCGYAHARISRLDAQQGCVIWKDVYLEGDIKPQRTAEGLRQFTGAAGSGSYWFTPGSSGSPVFLKAGQQLAGIVSVSERGANEGASPLHEAFVVPATTIHRYMARLIAEPVAEEQHVKLADLRPILEAIGARNVALVEIPSRLKKFVDAARARGEEPVRSSDDGTDIDAVIEASRQRLRALDTAGALDMLQIKIDKEIETRARRLVALLWERGAIERLAFNYEAAKSTFTELTKVRPDDVSAWITLGDLRATTGPLEDAKAAYRSAEAAAGRTGDKRGLAISHNMIGDVLMAEGDRAGAVDAYRAALAIRETLARRDLGNAGWQRDLSVSHEKIGSVLMAEGDRAGALDAYSAALAIAETLARRDPGNAEWQCDLAVSHNRIGSVLMAVGDRASALDAYRAAIAIRETVARRDPSNAGWQRDLSASHNRIGDVLMAEGDRAGALDAYRAALAIRETLARRDLGNTGWQRDLIVSYLKLSENEPDQASNLLGGALQIARRLHAASRLAPVDVWMLDELEHRLAAVRGGQRLKMLVNPANNGKTASASLTRSSGATQRAAFAATN